MPRQLPVWLLALKFMSHWWLRLTFDTHDAWSWFGLKQSLKLRSVKNISTQQLIFLRRVFLRYRLKETEKIYCGLLGKVVWNILTVVLRCRHPGHATYKTYYRYCQSGVHLARTTHLRAHWTRLRLTFDTCTYTTMHLVTLRHVLFSLQ